MRAVSQAARSRMSEGAARVAGKERRMKVAIAVEGNRVSEHFGRCQGFLMVTVEDEEIKSRDLVEAPPHEEGALPRLLADNGVDCLVAGGIGRRAQQFLAQAGIEIYGGFEGSAEDALSSYLLKNLESGGGACEGGMGTLGHKGPHGTGCH